MKTFAHTIPLLLALCLALVLPIPVSADGGGGSVAPKSDPDMTKANMAIQAQNWDQAIAHLTAAVGRDDNNADAYNLLGYAERKRGNLDAAFKYYERALTIDPKHRGAHEYLGEAYLLAGDLPKAEEQLAKLDSLCFFSCEEYRDLKAAIAEYKEKKPN
jgi:tetratricopeptide (TPR) repeat protein